jgi:hypothetical protein
MVCGPQVREIKAISDILHFSKLPVQRYLRDTALVYEAMRYQLKI